MRQQATRALAAYISLRYVHHFFFIIIENSCLHSSSRLYRSIYVVPTRNCCTRHNM